VWQRGITQEAPVIHNNAYPTEAQLVEELSTEFPKVFGADNELRRECVTIALYLSKADRVLVGLKELEARLQRKVGSELKRVVAHYQARAEQSDAAALKLDDGLRHLVTQEMTLVEIECGFNSFGLAARPGYQAGAKVQTYTRFMSSQAFLQEVALRRHWKDPTVPGDHGEYSHRLQWYLICTQLRGEITRQPAAVFGDIGPVLRSENDTSGYGLWFALFDREGEPPAPFRVAAGADDCRSPEELTRFLIHDKQADALPILHWYFKARMKKRKTGPLNEYFRMTQYVTDKQAKFGVGGPVADVMGKKNRKGEQVGGTGRFEPGPVFVRWQ
jgi:Family of unknown function (DUF5636)